MEKIKMTKEEHAKLREEYLADKKKQEDPKNKPKQPMSYFKFGKRAQMNKSLKKSDEILVFLLNLKKQIEGPISAKIYGGNFLVIRNHVYRFNPAKVFSFGKYKAVIAREFDRELVGIDDYEELVKKDFSSKNPGDRININDPVLIKALIAAKLSEKPQTQMSLGKWIIIGLVIIGIIVGFTYFSGKKGTTETPALPTG